MPHSTTSLMRATTWLMLALGAVYAVTLVPGIRPTPGYRAAIDWWLNMIVDGLVILVLALRVLVDRRDRAAWLVMTLGLVAAFAGSTAHFATTSTSTRSRAHRGRTRGGCCSTPCSPSDWS